MTTPARRTAAGPLKALMTLGVVGEESDARLLDVYRSGRPGADDAFRVLVERHGPTVHAVCRGVVPDPAEAHDAFQAVFLVLIRRAGAIRRAESLGPWLHGVALRVARKARRRALARSARLRLVAPEALAGAAPAPADRSDLIHAEIDRLPDRDRRPLVLCALEGLSYEQAARALGVSESTLRGRLHRARRRLEARLKAEGVDAPRSLIPPAPPAALLEAAIARASAASPVPASISSLAKGAMLAMSLSSWKPAVFSSLATLGVVGAAALGQQAGPGAEKKEEGPSAARAEEPKAEPPAPTPRPTEEEREAKNVLIRAWLAAPCPVDASDQPDENIELEQLLKRIKEATTTPERPGIAIYVSPVGLSIADKHLRSSHLFQPKDRSLGEALREYLALLGLGYAVDDGFLMIDSHASAADRRIDTVERKLDALIKKLEAAPIFFDEPRIKSKVRNER
ncbi:MAG: hypothetical protein BGO49_21970 [Planctomycetales bacterium 71-10]|nr:MAG: hypothetical protein BGO49_21970 [Planctomycetales bacterium 71-10]